MSEPERINVSAAALNELLDARDAQISKLKRDLDLAVLEARIEEAKHWRERRELHRQGYCIASDDEYIADLEANLQKQKAERAARAEK